MTIEFDPLETQHSDLDDSFRRQAFRVLCTGVAVAATELVAGSPSGADTARRTLDVLLQLGMAELDGGELVAIDGLSIGSTQHRMNLSGQELFTWCATDAIGIPTALDENAVVQH
jgi:alkylmercury lyase